MNVHWLGVAQIGALVVGVLAIPPVVRRLPEPPPVELPAPGSAEESELDRVLREEGPTQTYAEMADHLRRGWWAVWPLLLFVGVATQIGPPRIAWVSALLAPVFALLALVDWRRKLLPRVVVRPLTAVVLALALIDWAIRQDTSALVREGSGGLLAWGFFALLWLIRRAGMGFGDVRLAFPLGMLLAAISWNAWLVGIYAGFISFAAFGLAMLLLKRDRGVLKKAYPFGPFMILGAYAGMVLSPHLRILG